MLTAHDVALIRHVAMLVSDLEPQTAHKLNEMAKRIEEGLLASMTPAVIQ